VDNSPVEVVGHSIDLVVDCRVATLFREKENKNNKKEKKIKTKNASENKNNSG
jgi:hypothetical protein